MPTQKHASKHGPDLFFFVVSLLWWRWPFLNLDKLDEPRVANSVDQLGAKKKKKRTTGLVSTYPPQV